MSKSSMRKGSTLAALIFSLIASVTGSVQAGESGFLGLTQLNSNDATGDGHDRWQTASNSASLVFGVLGEGRAPEGFGQVWELRSGLQIITPENSVVPAAGDRQVAGALRSLAYNHVTRGNWEISLGAGIEAVGPSTRVTAFQDRFHEAIGFDRVAPTVLSAQIGDKLRPAAAAEAAYRFSFADKVTLRPFAEVHGGLESYGRIGADVLIGEGYRNGLLARDYVTGQLYQTVKGLNEPGLSFLVGADVAHVVSSAFLPEPAYALSPVRARLRGGMLVDFGPISAFYGATYLAPEFSGQSEGQVLGSMQLRFNF